MKYLDKEDIENLGFKEKWYEHGEYSMVKRDWIITFIPDGVRNIIISRYDKERTPNSNKSFKHDYRFKGIIKNKSELKKLLKQLSM